jgi:hypothetical protein
MENMENQDTPGTPTQPAQVSVAQPAAQPVAMLSPDGTQAKMIPFDQVDAAKEAQWEPAIKMYDSANTGTRKWVPSSQISGAHDAGWYPVLSQGQKAAVEGDAIKEDPIGNAIVTAGGSGLLKAGEALGEKALAPVAVGIENTVAQAADKAGIAKETAEYLAKEAAESISKMAGEHPLAASVIKRVLLGAATGAGFGAAAKHTTWLTDLLP